MSQVDVSEGADVAVLPLVGLGQLLRCRVALCLQPHLVLLQSGLVYGCGLLQHLRVVGLKGGHEVVYLLRRAVVVRVGQFAQPRSVQLIVVCHNRYVFSV